MHSIDSIDRTACLNTTLLRAGRHTRVKCTRVRHGKVITACMASFVTVSTSSMCSNIPVDRPKIQRMCGSTVNATRNTEQRTWVKDQLNSTPATAKMQLQQRHQAASGGGNVLILMWQEGPFSWAPRLCSCSHTWPCDSRRCSTRARTSPISTGFQE